MITYLIAKLMIRMWELEPISESARQSFAILGGFEIILELFLIAIFVLLWISDNRK